SEYKWSRHRAEKIISLSLSLLERATSVPFPREINTLLILRQLYAIVIPRRIAVIQDKRQQMRSEHSFLISSYSMNAIELMLRLSSPPIQCSDQHIERPT